MAAFDFPATPTVGQVYTANGVTYVWDSVAWRAQGGVAPLANNQRVTVVEGNAGTSGTAANVIGNYVKPSDLKFLQVELWGGGGGGQGSTAPAAGQQGAGTGGGGGGYCKKLYKAADLAASEPYVVGAGGNVQVGLGTSTGGNTSTFKGMSAGGGAGSPVASVPAPVGTAVYVNGGLGTGGDINCEGSASTPAFWSVTGNMSPICGGGGAAGGGGGGSTGGRSNGGSGAARTGLPGRAPGGGGAGGVVATTTPCDGAVGAGGRLVLTEYFLDNDAVSNAPPFDSLLVGSDGSVTSNLTIRGNHGNPFIRLISKWDGDTFSSPEIELFTDRAVWEDFDFAGALRFRMGDPDGSPKTVAYLTANVWDATPGSENANLYLGTISNGGNLDVLRLYDGIAHLTGGKLQFPSTQIPSTHANILDDYEEGLWTPGMAFGSGSGNAGITYTVQTGRYQKIGNKVQLWWDVTLSNKGAVTGAAYITGAPFTAGNVAAMSYVGSIGYFRDMVADSTQGIGCYVGAGSTLISLSGVNITAVQQTALQNTALTNVSRFLGSAAYEVA